MSPVPKVLYLSPVKSLPKSPTFSKYVPEAGLYNSVKYVYMSFPQNRPVLDIGHEFGDEASDAAVL